MDKNWKCFFSYVESVVFRCSSDEQRKRFSADLFHQQTPSCAGEAAAFIYWVWISVVQIAKL